MAHERLHWLIHSSSQVEYLVVAVDDKAKKARLSLRQADILKSLARDEALWKAGGAQTQVYHAGQ